MNVDIFSIRYTVYNRKRKFSLFTLYTETVIPGPLQWNIPYLALLLNNITLSCI